LVTYVQERLTLIFNTIEQLRDATRTNIERVIAAREICCCLLPQRETFARFAARVLRSQIVTSLKIVSFLVLVELYEQVVNAGG